MIANRAAPAASATPRVPVAVDDATPLAVVEVVAEEQKPTVIGFLSRVFGWFSVQGIECYRVRSDNGSAYVSKAFATASRTLGLRHIHTRPCTPRTNGTAERFLQTLCRERAYPKGYQNAEERNRWLHRYCGMDNRLKKHLALDWRPQRPPGRLRFAP